MFIYIYFEVILFMCHIQRFNSVEVHQGEKMVILKCNAGM